MKTTAQEHKARKLANLRRERTRAMKSARNAKLDAADPVRSPTVAYVQMYNDIAEASLYAASVADRNIALLLKL